jgi:glycosyltransferase involved in cell wall biosynthesis
VLNHTRKGFLISASVYLSDSPGGVQRCTREYVQGIKAAGWDLEILPYSIDRQWQTRLRRKLKPSSFHNRIPLSFITALVDRIKSDNVTWVFLNQVDTLPIVPYLKKADPNIKLVLLSHGAQFVDDFLAAQSVDSLSMQARARLADTILDEMHWRQSLDHVFTLSEPEAVFERWLGAKSVSWLPRIVSPNPLNWQPVLGRFGFVGTLDHAPNYDGLLNVLTELQSRQNFHGCIRIVSASESLGDFLAKRFPFVEYLGRLSAEALYDEAATWSCFVHPLFCWSRGCSTKLADALEWQIPVLTTESGCRGYTWKEGNVIMANTVEEFCTYLININSITQLESIKNNVTFASKTSPSFEDIANMVELALL